MRKPGISASLSFGPFFFVESLWCVFLIAFQLRAVNAIGVETRARWGV